MKYIKLILLTVLLSVMAYHQASAQKVDGQWLLNLSAQYKNKGGGFSIGGEKYIPNTYSSIRAEFSYLENKNRFSIRDFNCHVNTFALRVTYFYSLEMINTKPFALSVGTGIILGLEKIKGNFPFGVVKNKDNRLLSGIYLAPQVEIPLYKNLSAYFEPRIGYKFQSLQDNFLFTISLGFKYYLPF
ncbi:outer membrane beta-barrel protein [Butyricimonas virosa]|jgi:hypothetical protein